MNAIELARRMAQLGETKEALRAYALALGGECAQGERFEAALYTLQNEGDYKLAYTAFVSLYNEGFRRADLMDVLTQAFYEPNAKPLKNRYERNCRALEKYPYLFRRDFPSFDDLPLRFFPYDDHGGYVLYSAAEDGFRGYVNPNDTIVSRNFFRELDKPILADDVFSQYELSYLNDCVRPSEWVGRENHIYLHYTDWGQFCAYLAVLDLRALVESKKAVFLIGDELSRYPIDFKAEFGVDYSRCPVKPFAPEEIKRLIWHTQLSSHNGGDFFNEIFDAHPNLLWADSIFFDDVEAGVARLRAEPSHARRSDAELLAELYLAMNADNPALDRASRIAPAIFFQPHFGNIIYELSVREGAAELSAEAAERVHDSPILKGFPYIKTFTPMRRPTTSHGGTVRFTWGGVTGEIKIPGNEGPGIVTDCVTERVLNRSYLRDPDDRLYRDAVIVRFEDGKTNPRATFSALAAFLDLPYTESMTYGSIHGDRDPYRMGEAYQSGFGLWAVDKPYDEFENDAERYYIEYFLRDVYETYGYDFKWYDGAEVDEAKAAALIGGFERMDYFMRESWRRLMLASADMAETAALADVTIDSPAANEREQTAERSADEWMRRVRGNRLRVTGILLQSPKLRNRRGQPLRPTPLLRLDPALLERPLYH